LTCRPWTFHYWKVSGPASAAAVTAAGTIEYIRYGAGPAVLWLHGTPGGCDQAAFTAAGLAGQGFTLVCPSRPGYLGTALEVGRTPAEQADALAALLDTLGIAAAAVVATSGGGPVALDLAVRHRDRVWALVMVSAFSAAYTQPGSSLPRRIFLSRPGVWLLYQLNRRSPATAARAVLRPQGHFTGTDLRQALAQIEADPAKRRFIDGLIATMRPFGPRRPGIRNDLRQTARLDQLPAGQPRCPLLIIHGSADAHVPVGQARCLATAVPGAQLFEIPGAGHLVPLSSHATDANQRISGFLHQHAPHQ
jgi:pimeloyl-ACP methyl ester carboxylesterase